MDNLSSIRTRLSQEIKDLIDSKQSAKDFIIFMNKTLLEKYKDNPNWDAFCYLDNLQSLKKEHQEIDNQIKEKQAKLAHHNEIEPLVVETIDGWFENIYKSERGDETSGLVLVSAEDVEKLKQQLLGKEASQ